MFSNKRTLISDLGAQYKYPAVIGNAEEAIINFFEYEETSKNLSCIFAKI